MHEFLVSLLISQVVLGVLASTSTTAGEASGLSSTTAYESTIKLVEESSNHSHSVTQLAVNSHIDCFCREKTERNFSSICDSKSTFSLEDDQSMLLASEPGVQSSSSEQKAAPSAELAPPFHVSGKISRNVQKYSGLNWLTETSLNLGSSISAKLFLHGRPKVRFKIYAMSDCLAGKFKSVSIDLNHCSYRKIPIADLKLETTTPLQVRLFRTSKGAAGVGAPVMVAVSGQVDEKDVSRALQSPEISSQLNFLRLQLPGLGDQHLQVLEPKVKIENGKVKINTWLITANAPKETGITLDIVAKPYLDGERFIFLKETTVDSKDIMNPAEFSKFSEDLLNPLLDVGKFDRKTHAFRLTKFQLGEQNVQFAGKLLLVPKPVPAEQKPAENASR